MTPSIIHATLLSMNPYRALRDRAHLTQSQTSKLFGYSIQYLHRVENGLINTPPYELAEQLINYAVETNVTPDDVIAAYYEWVSGCRKAAKDILLSTDLLSERLLLYIPCREPYHPLEYFIANFNTIFIGRKYVTGNANSQQLFNRILCIHPRATQLSMKNRKGTLTPTLSDALKECGVSSLIIKELERRSLMWMVHHER